MDTREIHTDLSKYIYQKRNRSTHERLTGLRVTEMRYCDPSENNIELEVDRKLVVCTNGVRYQERERIEEGNFTANLYNIYIQQVKYLQKRAEKFLKYRQKLTEKISHRIIWKLG